VPQEAASQVSSCEEKLAVFVTFLIALQAGQTVHDWKHGLSHHQFLREPFLTVATRVATLPLLTIAPSGWLISWAIDAATSPIIVRRVRARAPSAALHGLLGLLSLGDVKDRVDVFNGFAELGRNGWPRAWIYLIDLSARMARCSTEKSLWRDCPLEGLPHKPLSSA
jgi:hypothetical protein